MAVQHHRKGFLDGRRYDVSSSGLLGYQWLINRLHHVIEAAVGSVNWMQKSTSFRFCAEMITLAGVLITVAGFWYDRSARVENRVHQAWTLVASNDGGNIGLIEALEFLNDKGIDISSLDLSNAHLHAVKLEGANLNHGNFRNAELSKSMLAKAKLGAAKLHGAKLFGADLTGATLAKADLTRAKLRGADLRSVNLDAAILVGATLIDAKVSDDWQETAWFCNTTMPDGGSNNKDCAKLVLHCEDLSTRGSIAEDYMEGVCKWLSNREDDLASLSIPAADAGHMRSRP